MYPHGYPFHTMGYTFIDVAKAIGNTRNQHDGSLIDKQKNVPIFLIENPDTITAENVKSMLSKCFGADFCSLK